MLNLSRQCYFRWIRAVVLTAVAVATLISGVSAAKNALEPSSLAATPDQVKATELINHFIERYHYRKRTLNDALSKEILDRYLTSLDPNRSYFLASDIKEFSKFEVELDDALRDADLAPAFQIFRRLQTRMEERVDFAKKLLAQGDFDFTQKEEFLPDRSEAAWARDQSELDEIWRKRVKNDALTLKLAGKTQQQIIDNLIGRYQRLATRMQRFDSDDVYQAFINAYTGAIEPHTSYFSRRASDNFKIRMSLSLEGIGAALQSRNEHTLVLRVIPGGPAEQSGLLGPDDRITGVGQGDEEIVDVVGWRLAEVVDLIRGPKGTKVRLEILPKGAPPDGPTKVISLVRNEIKLEEQAAQKAVRETILDGHKVKIGVIKVPTFYTDFEAREKGKKEFRSTTRDVRRLISELKDDGIAGLVIDLRANGGGSLAEATELTGLFIRSGPIVQVRDYSGRLSINDDPDPEIAYDGPLAVLVDRHSASASEIFAGAIQDYRRGLILGEPTFGKGTVQRLIDLSRFAPKAESALGQLKFTVAQFFRVNGDSTQHRGVVPDFIFPTVMDGDESGERAFENALPWAAVKPVPYHAGHLNSKVLDMLRDRHVERIRKDPGFGYLLAEAEAEKQSRERKSVSLLEKERRDMRSQIEQAALDRLNAYHKAIGLAPVASLLDRDQSEDDLRTREEREKRAKEKQDILRDEATNIVADLFELTHNKRLMTENP